MFISDSTISNHMRYDYAITTPNTVINLSIDLRIVCSLFLHLSAVTLLNPVILLYSFVIQHEEILTASHKESLKRNATFGYVDESKIGDLKRIKTTK